MRVRLFVALLALTMLVGLAQALGSQAPNTFFTLALLPDTQKYAADYPHIYTAQTAWLAYEGQKPLFQVPFVAHLGDVVDNPSRDAQWQVADAAHSLLDAATMPYSIQAGNHDLLAWLDGPAVVSANADIDRDPNSEPFLAYFPTSRLEPNSYGDQDVTGFNRWHHFQGAGERWLLLALDWRPSRQSLAWAQAVLDVHAGWPTIVTTHQFFDIDTGQNPIWTENARYLWDELIRHNSQIFLVVSGHHSGTTHTIAQNDVGADVVLMLVDYQSMAYGGSGYLRLLELDIARSRIAATSVSPWILRLSEAERSQLRVGPVQLTDAANQFSIAFDFTGRFSGFPEFTPDMIRRAEAAAQQRTAARERYFGR